MLTQEADSGFPHFSGSRVSGTVRLAASAVNDWLRRVSQLPPGIELDIQAGNRVVVLYGVIRATAILDEEVRLAGGAARIRFVLASGLVAFALRHLLHNPAVAVEGREVTVDLGVLDRGGRYRPYWALLQRVRLQTTSGQVHIEFEAAVR